ncbi:MAG: hypothetical protein JWP46_2930 [Modestobacter sp.]|jgi:hypothetical protein|nr:hypothetical protein [Modestobacter sp.]
MLGIDTSPFATWSIDTSGIWWDVTRVLSAVTLVGFTVATCGLFARHSWWEAAALASAVLGLLVLIPYGIAVHGAGEPTPWFHLLLHALGCAGVFLLLLVPVLEAWVNEHVMSRQGAVDGTDKR